MDNITEFNRFRKSIQYDNNGELYLTFPAKVKYVKNGKTDHETLNVTLKYDTLTYGQVSIENGQILTPEEVHLDFHPEYQQYLYEHKGVLVITGSSPKMGNYTVEIMCL